LLSGDDSFLVGAALRGGAPPASGDEGRRNAHGLAGLRTIPCRACLGLGKRPDWAKEEGPGL